LLERDELKFKLDEDDGDEEEQVMLGDHGSPSIQPDKAAGPAPGAPEMQQSGMDVDEWSDVNSDILEELGLAQDLDVLDPIDDRRDLMCHTRNRVFAAANFIIGCIEEFAHALPTSLAYDDNQRPNLQPAAVSAGQGRTLRNQTLTRMREERWQHKAAARPTMQVVMEREPETIISQLDSDSEGELLPGEFLPRSRICSRASLDKLSTRICAPLFHGWFTSEDSATRRPMPTSSRPAPAQGDPSSQSESPTVAGGPPVPVGVEHYVIDSDDEQVHV
jgi:hypothetical protein